MSFYEIKNYYFIDCGANEGKDILNFYSNLNEEHDTDKFQIIAFEANRRLLPKLSNLKSVIKNFTIIDKAVSNVDGVVSFRAGIHTYCSSINPAKNNFIVAEEELVPCIDLSRWLSDNTAEGDYVIVNLDVEGAEYDIVDSLFESGMINRIRKLYIEFHGKKLDGFLMKREKKMVKKLINHFGKDVYIYHYHQHEEFLKLNVA